MVFMMEVKVSMSLMICMTCIMLVIWLMFMMAQQIFMTVRHRAMSQENGVSKKEKESCDISDHLHNTNIELCQRRPL